MNFHKYLLINAAMMTLLIFNQGVVAQDYEVVDSCDNYPQDQCECYSDPYYYCVYYPETDSGTYTETYTETYYPSDYVDVTGFFFGDNHHHHHDHGDRGDHGDHGQRSGGSHAWGGGGGGHPHNTTAVHTNVTTSAPQHGSGGHGGGGSHGGGDRHHH